MPRFTLHVPKRNEEDLGNVLDTRYVNVAGDTDITGSLIPNADSAIDLGSSTKLWANIYTDNLYVHSGVYLTETAGAVTGVTVQHASSANYIAFVVSTDPVRIIPWGESSGNTLDISGHLTPVSDSSKTLGNTARYWLSTYTDKLYLNSTAILDGATAGVAKLNGGLLVEPDIDTLTALVVNDTDSNNVLTVDTINNRVATNELRALSASGLKLYEDGGSGIFVQDSTGNVGVGTTGPGAKLDLQGDMNVDASLVLGSGTTTAAMNFNVDFSGGSSLPNVAAQLFTLSTQNAVSNTHQVYGTNSTINDTGANYIYDVHGVYSRYNFNTATNRRSATSNNVQLKLDGNGTITDLIGLKVSAYSYNSVTGSATNMRMIDVVAEKYQGNFTAGTYYGISHRDKYGSLDPFATVGNRYFLYSEYGESQLRAGSATEKVLTLRGATSQTANLTEWQNSGGTALTVVDKDGNVGIGTTAPGQALTVYGAGGTGIGNVAQFITDGSSSARNAVNITDTQNAWGLILSKNSSGVSISNYHGPDWAHIINVDNAPLVLGANNTGHMWITGGGNVGIGTTTPASKLEVNGGVNIGGTGAIADNNLYVESNCSALTFTDRTPFYEGNALEEIKGIKSIDVDGKKEIDHSTLPTFARKKLTMGIPTEIIDEKTKEKTTELVEEVRTERDLGAMISILTVAIQELNSRIEILEVK